MAFCSSCGAEIKDNSKFCSECGIAISQSEGKRKTEFEGTIHKCPNCGETLNAFAVTCFSCGYELREATTSTAVQEFAKRFELAKDEEQRVNLIRNFVIPNTKEDILEFIILASTNAGIDNESQEIVNAWLVKLEQCHHKVNLMLVNDQDYEKITQIYKKTYKRVKKAQRSSNYGKIDIYPNSQKQASGGITKYLGIISGLVLFIIAINLEKSNGAGDGVICEFIGGILVMVSSGLIFKKQPRNADIAVGIITGIISFALATQLKNGIFLQLSGFVAFVIVAVNYFKSFKRR